MKIIRTNDTIEENPRSINMSNRLKSIILSLQLVVLGSNRQSTVDLFIFSLMFNYVFDRFADY